MRANLTIDKQCMQHTNITALLRSMVANHKIVKILLHEISLVCRSKVVILKYERIHLSFCYEIYTRLIHC